MTVWLKRIAATLVVAIGVLLLSPGLVILAAGIAALAVGAYSLDQWRKWRGESLPRRRRGYGYVRASIVQEHSIKRGTNPRERAVQAAHFGNDPHVNERAMSNGSI